MERILLSPKVFSFPELIHKEDKTCYVDWTLI